MRDDYVRAYRDLYQKHWWWRAREDFLVAVLRGHLPERPLRRILDVGCGGGLFFGRLAAFGSVYGVEPDVSMRLDVPEIDRLIHWGPLDTFESTEAFSAVLLLDVLEHLDDPVGFLKRVGRLLEPGGVVVATVPAFTALWTTHDDVNEHVTRYTKGSFGRVLRQAGYQAQVLRYFFHWLFPVKLAVRFLEQVRPAAGGSAALPSVPSGVINRALYGLSRLEQWCHLDRVMPFGSSLLFVGSPRP